MKELTEQEKQHLELETRCVHAGEAVDEGTKAIRRPIVMANSYHYPGDPEGLGHVFDWGNPRGFYYPRGRAPNTQYLEERLAGIEKAEDCLVTSSGVSAMAAVFFTFLSSGDHVISSNICYIAVHNLLKEHLAPRFGMELTMVDTTDLEAVKKAVQPNTKLIHIETPGNPNTQITDIAAIAEIARQAGALLSVDSTWGGMILQQPLALGADLDMHSITKYVNGHGDTLGGALLGKKELITKLRETAHVNLGSVLSPFAAWLIMRGSATLPLRMARHCENAMAVARFLEAHKQVEFVRYPGLESHPQHEIAKKQMSDFGGMLNFALTGADDKTYLKVMDQFQIISHATCLGHQESLAQYYPQGSDCEDIDNLKYPEEIGKAFIRFSTGLENSKDLCADIDQAIKTVIPA